jgi:hypothetical protein
MIFPTLLFSGAFACAFGISFVTTLLQDINWWVGVTFFLVSTIGMTIGLAEILRRWNPE